MAYNHDYENRAGDWEQVRVVTSHRTRSDDYGDTVEYTVYVKFPRKVSRQEAAFAAHSLFTTYCQHSYDCCGHFYCSPHTSRMRRVRSRTWMVPLVWSRNV